MTDKQSDNNFDNSGEIRNSIIVQGNGNNVRLIIGPHKVPLSRPHYQDAKPSRHPRKPLDILNPLCGLIAFQGRDAELTLLQNWLAFDDPVSVHAIIGDAGLGKTRLASQLCGLVDSPETDKKDKTDRKDRGQWQAGFVRGSQLPKLTKGLASLEGLDQQLLWIIDDAAQYGPAISALLDQLNNLDITGKIRILVLERHAHNDLGWWHDLFHQYRDADQFRQDLLDPGAPLNLGALPDQDMRRAILAASYDAARQIFEQQDTATTERENLPPPGQDSAFDTLLADDQFGNSLSLSIAGLLAADQGFSAALSQRHLAAAQRVAANEQHRLTNLGGEKLVFLAAWNALARGMPTGNLTGDIAHILPLAHFDTANTRDLADQLRQEYGQRDQQDTNQALTTIQPDLIAEAFIIKTLICPPHAETAMIQKLLQESWDRYGQAMGSRFIEAVQDFAHILTLTGQNPDQSSWSPQQTQEWQTAQTLMHQFEQFIDSFDDPSSLMRLSDILPKTSLLLAQMAEKITRQLQSVLAIAYQQNPADTDIASLYGTALTNLATKQSELGHQEDALTTAAEAVSLRRKLAQERPDAFLPNLATSLNNLANMQSKLGHREDALTTIQEAIGIYRRLSNRHPGVFDIDLARSLGQQAMIQWQTEQEEDALAGFAKVLALTRPLFLEHPAAIGKMVVATLKFYLKLCEELQQEPDGELVGPIIEVLQAFQQAQNGDEPGE